MFDVEEYADDTTLLTECVDRILQFIKLAAEENLLTLTVVVSMAETRFTMTT